MKKLVLAALIALLMPLSAHAQQLTQNSPTHLDAAQLVSTFTTSSGTLSITPPSGQYVYINNVEISNCAGTVITAATPTNITTTNLGGAAWMLGSGSTAGLCQPSPASGSFVAGFRSSAPGTAISFIFPALIATQNVRLSVYYYFAP